MLRRNKHLILFACFGVILILGGFLFLRSAYVLNRVRLVHQFTEEEATVYTDEWQGYSGLNRYHATVCHSPRRCRIA